jgi:adenine phosphoribosyltransferase
VDEWPRRPLSGVPRPRDVGQLGPALAAPFDRVGITVVVALEARGFVVGALCAEQIAVGLVLARKADSVHPRPKVEVISAPDWQGRQITIQFARVLSPADRALLVDDWIYTGSQARAVKEAIEACGAELVGTSVVVDDTTADVRADLKVIALVGSAELRAV